MRSPVKPEILDQIKVGLDLTGITTLEMEVDPDGKTGDIYNPNNGRKGFIWIIVNGTEIYAGAIYNATSIETLNSFAKQMISIWQAAQAYDAFLLSLVV